MVATLSERAKESSTIAIGVAFYDESNNSVVPTSATWSLTDADENIINGRDDEVLTPAASVNIVLTGDDLALTAAEISSGKRWLIVKAIYNSTVYGSGLYMKDSVAFYIDDLKDV